MTEARIIIHAECADVTWNEMSAEIQCLYAELRDALEKCDYEFRCAKITLENSNPSIACTLEIRCNRS